MHLNAERLAFQPGPGRSEATEGLQKLAAHNQLPPILLQMGAVEPAQMKARSGSWKWAIAAGALILGLAATPYISAELGRPRLERKLAAIKAERGNLALIDQELGFLQDLKKRQSPYMEALYLIADAAPQGAKIDSLNMNHNGDVALRVALQNGQLVNDFRSKLIASGFFANVVVDEQTPTPNRTVVARMTMQWKPAEAREKLNIGPKIDESKTNSAAAASTNRPAAPPPAMPTNAPAVQSNAAPSVPPPPASASGAPPAPARVPRGMLIQEGGN